MEPIIPWTWEVIPSMFIRILFGLACSVTLEYSSINLSGSNLLADTSVIFLVHIMLALLMTLIGVILVLAPTTFYAKVPPEQHDLKPFIKLRIVMGISILMLIPFAFQAMSDDMTFYQALLLSVFSVAAPLKFIHDGYLIKRIKNELYHNPKLRMRTIRAKGFFL